MAAQAGVHRDSGRIAFQLARTTLVGVVLLGNAILAQDRPSDYADWYLRHYGAASAAGAEEAALVARAERVFEAVREVADRKAGRGPTLVVVDRRSGLGAQALPDGSIIVDPGLLRFCFGPPGRPAAVGDARLAFVLGHEMAHLAYDDTWHARAFAAAAPSGDVDRVRATAPWREEEPAVRQAKEMRADRAGFLFLLMAGFSADSVLGGEDDFLAAWAALANGEGSADDSQHPAFSERATALRVATGQIAAELPFASFGARLLALGRFDDAIALLERFRSAYPGREVSTNLGLAYYRRAMLRLAACGSDEGLRFRLSTLIAPMSIATRISLRSGSDAACRGLARQELETARELLAEAHAQAPDDLAARLDLSAVLIALRRGYEAYLATGLDRSSASGVAARSTDPRLLVAGAVAQHVAREESPVDTSQLAVDMLELAEQSPKVDADTLASIAFNLARIEEERGHASAAGAGWRGFIARESEGVWADEARRYLGVVGLTGAGREAAEPAPLAKRLPGKVARALDRGRRETHALGAWRVAFVVGEGVSAFERDGEPMVVEEVLYPAREPWPPTDQLGRPQMVLVTAPGRETRVYSGIAYDVEGGMPVTRIWFEAPATR